MTLKPPQAPPIQPMYYSIRSRPELKLTITSPARIEREHPMIARIRKSLDEKEKGFTLIELLVVMIIIGILAAIAIPVFLNQRTKAAETAAKADVSTIGKEIAAYYVDGIDALTLTNTAAGAVPMEWILSDTTAELTRGTLSGKNITGTSTAITDFETFCVSVDPAASVTGAMPWSYGGGVGLKKGATC